MRNLNFIHILILCISVCSCRDEGTNPLPLEGTDDLTPYLTLELENNFLNSENLESEQLSGILTDLSGEVESYDINVSLFRASTGERTDTVFVKRITEFGEFSVSALEVAAALDFTLGDLLFNDRLDFICSFSDGETVWRTDGEEANIGPDLLASEILPQAFSYSVYVGCELVAPFTGKYEMRQESGGTGFWGPIFTTKIVEVTAPSPFRRQWEAVYYTFDVDFEIVLECGQVKVPYTTSGIGCGGPGINWVEDDELATYHPNNDSYFTINIIENVENGCGAGVNPGTVISMTKVEL